MNTPSTFGFTSASWRAWFRRNLAQRPLALHTVTTVMALALALSLVLRMSGLVYAQTNAPRLTITGIQVDQFPTVSVTVFGENLDTDFTQVPLTLSEDGAPKTATATIEETGAQTLLVVDAYKGINLQGMTGALRTEEVVNAISRLTGSETEPGYLLANKDWLGFVSFDNSGERAVPKVLSSWNRDDHGLVINDVITYIQDEAPNAKEFTPLYDLLFDAILYFDERTPPQNLPRSIVVFSDGNDIIATADKENLYRLAAERNIRIHTVQFGPADRTPQQNLQNIAQNTGGRYVHLNQETALLPDLWSTIQASSTQQVLSYRSSKASPGSIIVSAEINGQRLDDRQNFPAIDVRPPSINITVPSEGELTKTLPGGGELLYNTPLADLEPKEMEIRIEVGWPDGFPRTLQRVEYSIGDQTITAAEPPFESVIFPIGSLDNGNYTIRVSATDELGLRADATPKSFSIVVNRPAAPDFGATATVEAAATQTAMAVIWADSTATAEVRATESAVSAAATSEALAAARAEDRATSEAQGANLVAVTEANETLTITSYAGIGTAVLALGAAIFVWANPRTRKRATQIVTGTIGRLTEFWSPGGAMSAPNRQLKARLIPVSEGEGLTPVDIFGGSARIGRDAALATIVINDRRVSRYHCRISEEGDGLFRIWDEGSTSGTYVNHEQVSMSGRVLQAGDLINFGPVQYRFEPVTVTASGATDVYDKWQGGDATEPFVLTPPNAGQVTHPYVSPGGGGNEFRTEPNFGVPDTNFKNDATVVSETPDFGSQRPSERETDRYTSPRRGSDDATRYYSDRNNDRSNDRKTNTDDTTRG